MGDVKSQEAARLADHERRIRVRALLLMGYMSKVISIETGWSQKRVRQARAMLMSDPDLKEFAQSAIAAKPATSKTLIRSMQTQREMSVLMLIYSRLHAGYLSSIDPFKLARAYGLFIAVTQGQGGEFESVDVTINDAWELAAELRSHEAMLFTCTVCSTTFYEALSQGIYRSMQPCPWCSQQAKSAQH